MVQEYAADDANTKDVLCTAVISPTLTIALEKSGNSQLSSISHALALMQRKDLSRFYCRDASFCLVKGMCHCGATIRARS